MTIHGSPSTLDIVVRMLAGLWDGAYAVAIGSLWRGGGSSTLAGLTVDCFRVRHQYRL